MPPAKCTLETPPKLHLLTSYMIPYFLHTTSLAASRYSDRELRLSDQEKHKRNPSPSHVHSEWPALLSEKRWSPRGPKIGKRINLHNAKARYKTDRYSGPNNSGDSHTNEIRSETGPAGQVR